MADGKSASAIIVFDASPTSEERAEWIEAGARDVIEQGQCSREWVARCLRAVGGRAHHPLERESDSLVVGPFRIDLRERRTWIDSTEVALTPLELGLLAHLASRANSAVTHEELRAMVLAARDRMETSKLRTHVSHLRHKLGCYGALIETVRPRRYRLRLELETRPDRGAVDQ